MASLSANAPRLRPNEGSTILRRYISSFVCAFGVAGLLFAVSAQAEISSLPDGQIWSTKASVRVDAGELKTALAKARFVLLGEIHDNAVHHLWQAWSISVLGAKRSGDGIVALEMVRTDRASHITRFYETRGGVAKANDAGGFAHAVGWMAGGWQDFKIYAPVIEAALESGFRLKAADTPIHLNRLVGRSGFVEFSATRRSELALDRDLNAQLQNDLDEDIKVGHCNLLPDRMLANMANVQRLRDAAMADVLLKNSAGTARLAILIAGNGHVRRDRGVPWYLERRGVAGKDILVVGTAEVDNVNAKRLNEKFEGRLGALYDFVIVSPVVERADPCERLRKHFKQKPKK